MTNLYGNCLRCGSSFEIVATSEEVVCGSCSTSYRIRRDQGVVSLSEIGIPESSIKSNLTAIEEMIEATSTEIEELRSHEQSGPLQLGCAFFGLFSVVILVLVIFMLLGKDYLGGWLFYLSLSAVVVLGVIRIRAKLSSLADREEFRRRRIQLESEVAALDRERSLISDRETENSQSQT